MMKKNRMNGTDVFQMEFCRDHKLTDDDDDDENKKKYFFLYKKNFNDCFQVSVKLNTQ